MDVVALVVQDVRAVAAVNVMAVKAVMEAVQKHAKLIVKESLQEYVDLVMDYVKVVKVVIMVAVVAHLAGVLV